MSKHNRTEKTADGVFAISAKHGCTLVRAAIFCTAVAFALAPAPQCYAQQNAPQATREGEFSAFGGYTNAGPDYGPFRDQGGTVGVDFTRYFHRLLAPSVEARFNFNNGDTINETNSLIGLRLQADIKRFHPYGNFLIGAGHLTFKSPIPPTYVHDTAFAKSIGGGVNFDVSRYFQLKADYQYELINFGKNNLVNNRDFTLTPSYFTAGVVYRFPFRKSRGQNSKP